jgi:hypothetical protein
MNKLIISAFLAISAFVAPAQADEIAHFGLHIASVHVPQYNYNNANPGIYVRMESGMTYGAYYNSERRMSAYAGYTYDFNDTFSVTVGVISGYKMGGEKTRIMPMVVPTMKLGKIGETTFRLAVIPQLTSSKRQGSTVIHLMAEW